MYPNKLPHIHFHLLILIFSQPLGFFFCTFRKHFVFVSVVQVIKSKGIDVSSETEIWHCLCCSWLEFNCWLFFLWSVCRASEWLSQLWGSNFHFNYKSSFSLFDLLKMLTKIFMFLFLISFWMNFMLSILTLLLNNIKLLMVKALQKPWALMQTRKRFLITRDTIHLWFKEGYLNNEKNRKR